MRNEGIAVVFCKDAKNIFITRDVGGVPRKTAGFVGCIRGRRPLRVSNSRGEHQTVGSGARFITVFFLRFAISIYFAEREKLYLT